MEPKRNEKGKLVPYKGPVIPKLYDLKQEKAIRVLMDWYQSKLKPHSKHFYDCVTEAIKLENDVGYVPISETDPKRINKDQQKNNKTIEDNAEKIITVIIQHIQACFQAFDFHLKKGNEMSSLASTQYATSTTFSIMDVMLYNEIF